MKSSYLYAESHEEKERLAKGALGRVVCGNEEQRSEENENQSSQW